MVEVLKLLASARTWTPQMTQNTDGLSKTSLLSNADIKKLQSFLNVELQARLSQSTYRISEAKAEVLRLVNKLSEVRHRFRG